MGIEIERKFLVKGDFTPFVSKRIKMQQAYLSVTPKSTVRVRIKGEKGFLTTKGPSDQKRFSHAEFEYQIPFADAEKIMKLAPSGTIEKVRNYVPYQGHTYEVDVFEGRHKGLVFAELELESEKEAFEKPEWLGKEVTGDIRYYNSYLSTHPGVPE